VANEGKSVEEILVGKKASVRQAPLPPGFPGWDAVATMVWEEVVRKARANEPGFRELRKLLSDKRFDK
jgi:hypothetical protein